MCLFVCSVVCMCVVKLFFVKTTWTVVFLILTNLARMIYVPIYKKLEQVFKILILKFFGKRFKFQMLTLASDWLGLLQQTIGVCFIGDIVNDVVPTSVEFLTSNHCGREHLQPTVRMSEDGICSRLNGKVGKGPDTEDMVTVAIRINTDTLQNIKVWTHSFFRLLYLDWYIWMCWICEQSLRWWNKDDAMVCTGIWHNR